MTASPGAEIARQLVQRFEALAERMTQLSALLTN
jgi:hypothetical protein